MAGRRSFDDFEPFDPKGSGYDYGTANRAGLKPKPVEHDTVPHWLSREPETGMLLNPKMSKTEADYGRGMGMTRCRNCTFFHPNARRCAKVEGPIEPAAWCRLFAARR